MKILVVKTHNISLGSVIASLRNKSHISQEELAARAGVHRTYISQLERDLKSPTVDTLKNIALALGIKTSRLIRLTEGNPDEL
ncbi:MULTISPECIES: helix-turn-helix domain-containing protein [Acidobacteriaceae]|uniref:helix-turn-helix domain-containing protein n=1 Tax=Acidobacteriaceae TaxID=204434 RepID=UPI001C205FA6|nr:MULTISPECIES: helix-turn-helix transcriptional regulator [Acidobacteriaceae]MDW5264829.1 helix-turn-helix transcriptional regulator [Edaphobacter sp.]